MFSPSFHEGHVDGATRAARAQVVRSRRPQQRDAVGSVVGVERRLLEEGFSKLRKFELFVVIRKLLGTLQQTTAAGLRHKQHRPDRRLTLTAWRWEMGLMSGSK